MIKWVRIMITFCLLLCLSISCIGCGTQVPAVSVDPAMTTTGDQSAFLNDMADGITERFSNADKDTSNMPREEMIKYYSQLVGYELDKISQYEAVKFENSKFNDFAHAYIDACNMQLLACKYYKNTEFYSAVWDSSRNIRSYIITELYNNYDLPITAEVAEEFSSNSTQRMTVSNKEDTSAEHSGANFHDSSSSIADAIEISEFEPYTQEGSSLQYIKFKVTNISSSDISTVTFYMNWLDENGDIINSSQPQELSSLKPGQSIYFDTFIEDNGDAAAVQLFHYWCYKIDGSLEEYFENDIDMEPFILN